MVPADCSIADCFFVDCSVEDYIILHCLASLAYLVSNCVTLAIVFGIEPSLVS